MKYLIFCIFLVFCMPITAHAVDCNNPADCETAIGCGVIENFGAISADYSISDIVADAIFENIHDACVNFNFEYGWNNFNANGLSIDWKAVKNTVIDKVNYDPSSKNFTFLVTENAWYALGGKATGIVIGSVVIIGATICTIATVGVCAGLGLAGGVGIGTAGTAIGATQLVLESSQHSGISSGNGGKEAISVQHINISAADKLKVKATKSDWDGCINLTNDGITSTVSDLFTTDVIRPVFPELRGTTFAFNASLGNLLLKNGELFMMTADQKGKVMGMVPKIADKGACDWHAWKLYLYPVRIFMEDIDAQGQWKFDFRVENDYAIIDK